MNDQQKQFAEMVANSNVIINTAIRQLVGGYVVSASTNYVDKQTGGVAFAKNDECVASTPEDAAQKSLNFHRSGNFEGNVPAPATTTAAPATI